MSFLFGGSTANKVNTAAFTDPNLQKNQDLINQQKATLAGQPGAQLNTGQSDQSRGLQTGLASSLTQTMNGQGPSAATIAANQTADRGIAQQMAMSAGMGGGANPGLVQRQALTGGAGIAQNAASVASQGRAQEALNAQTTLAGVTGTMRTQDITQAGAQATLDAQHLQQQNDLTQKYVAMGLSVDQAQFQAQQDLAKTQASLMAGDADRTGRGVGSILQAGGTVAAALV